eukprot:1348416-Rhodomonas_salina.1
MLSVCLNHGPVGAPSDVSWATLVLAVEWASPKHSSADSDVNATVLTGRAVLQEGTWHKVCPRLRTPYSHQHTDSDSSS